MHISPEGRIAIALALVGLAGVGLPLVVHNAKPVGWIFIVISGIGGVALARNHLVATGTRWKHAVRPLGAAALYGVILCGLALASLVALHFWPLQENRAVSTSAPEASPPIPPTQAKQSTVDPEEPSETGQVFSNRPIGYFSNLVRTENAIRASAIMEPYIGTLLKFTAIVHDNDIHGVANGPFFAGLSLEDGSPLVCGFSYRFKNYLARLDDNQKIEITATLDGTSGQSLSLKACHPIEASSTSLLPVDPASHAFSAVPASKATQPVTGSGDASADATKTRQNPDVSMDRYPRKTCFDYSTYDGVTVVNLNNIIFKLHFSKASNTSIYLYRNGRDAQSVAVLRNAKPGDDVDFNSVDKTSSVYSIPLGAYFFVQNADEYVLLGRVLSLKDDTRGDDKDEVCFVYTIDLMKTGKFKAI